MVRPSASGRDYTGDLIRNSEAKSEKPAANGADGTNVSALQIDFAAIFACPWMPFSSQFDNKPVLMLNMVRAVSP